MAFRTWARLLGAALGVAALAGASQLGVAYGLGIVRLTRVLDAAARDQWTAQLAWVAWLAMTAAALGGLAGGWLRDRSRVPGRVGVHIALAAAAGTGAAIVVPLTMQPARTAQVAGVQPVFVIGVCAAIGALVGALAAYAALAHLVARWNITVVGLAVWVIALVSVAPSLAPGDNLPSVRLGVFDAGFLSPAVTQRTALFTMPALALLVGAAHGWTARRREMPTLTIALAGLPGPVLLTLAYLIAGPGSGDERYQVVPYWAAMTATGAGVLGSVLAAVIRRGDDTPQSPAEPDETGTRLPGQRPAPPVTGTAPDGASAVAPPGPGQTASATSPSASPPTPPPGPPPAAPPSSAPPPMPSSASPLPPPPASPIQRRSSAADAFTARSGEWPARRTEPAGRGGVPLGDYAGSGSEPFDAFGVGPGASAPRDGAQQHAATEPPPYVPEPAARPEPPEAGPETPARARGLRGRMPFGRNRGRNADTSADRPETPLPRQAAADRPQAPLLRQAPAFRDAPAAPTWPGRQPLVPEPYAVSAPLPRPEPITPPLPVTPAPDERRDRRRPADDEFVDWVSGLGTRDDDR
jgi:MFS family permease